jgi:hypothetical protein
MQSTVWNPPKPGASSNPPYDRHITRTPSPTPSEQAALADDGKSHLSELLKPENWSEHTRPLAVRCFLMACAETLIIVVVIVALVVLMFVFHDQLVNDFKPAAKWMHESVFIRCLLIAVALI